MKGRALLVAALLVVAVVTLAACGDDGNGAEPAATPAATPGTTTPASEDTPDGGAVFAAQCAGCHDEDGSGGIGPDLRGEDDLAEIEDKVRNGGSGMPAFAESLSEAEISAVAAHVTGL